MENAIDAFKMAFAVMVFVIALSITVYAFTEAKTATDTLISFSDRESDYYYDDSQETENKKNFYYVATDEGETRIVNVESIVPTIYRAYKENYKIVFDPDLIGGPLYYKKDPDDPNKIEGVPVYSIDLQDVSLSTGNQEEFLNGIMYRKFEKEGYISTDGSNIVNLKDPGAADLFPGSVNKRSPRKYFKTVYQLADRSDAINWDESLYDILNRKNDIVEHLGTFYQEDEGQTTEDDLVPEANKTKKRVITYTKST